MKCAWNGLSDLYDIQGNFCIASNNYEEAHQIFRQQLQICQNLPSNHRQYGKCYANIGNLYESEKNNDLALDNYQKALSIYQRSLPVYHSDITRIKYSIEHLTPSELNNN